MKITPAVIFAAILSAIVIGAITAGLYISGSPFAARYKKIDQQRISDLQNLERRLDAYVTKNQQLPDTLDQLQQNNRLTVKTSDEENNPYEYIRTDATNYQLCATFHLATDEDHADAVPVLFNADPSGEWTHSSGRSCFTRSAAKYVHTSSLGAYAPPVAAAISAQAPVAQGQIPATQQSQITPAQAAALVAALTAAKAAPQQAQTPPASSAASVVAQPAVQQQSAQQPAYAQPVQAATSPASLGFQQYYKCMRDVAHLGDTGTAENCLAACRMQTPPVAGCWWLDGSGGLPRDCRACKSAYPVMDHWSNDWGVSFSR